MATPEIRGLTVREPHAMLIALADRKRYPIQSDLCKRIETRPRRISYRGLLAIHAAKAFPPPAQAMCQRYPFYQALSLNYDPRLLDVTLPKGRIVALARLFKVEPITAELQRYMRDRRPIEYAFGDYTPGRWAWILEDIRALPEPILAKGAQGLWRLSPDLAARVLAAVGEVR